MVAIQTSDISSFIDTKQFCNFDVIKRSNQQKGCCSCSVCSVHQQRSHPWGGVKLVRVRGSAGFVYVPRLLVVVVREKWWRYSYKLQPGTSPSAVAQQSVADGPSLHGSPEHRGHQPLDTSDETLFIQPLIIAPPVLVDLILVWS